MVKLIALYKVPANIAEFDENYFNGHIPLAMKMPGLKKAEVSRITGSPMGAAEYHLMAELYFENKEALDAAMSSAEGRAAAKNLMGFAKEVVYMMFAEVEEKVPAAV